MTRHDPVSSGATRETVTRSDKALLSRLRNAITQCVAYNLTLPQLERRLAGIEVAHWRRLQAQMEPMTRMHAELSCILAYFGVDVANNVAFLLQPYRHYSTTPETYGALLERSVGYLSLVYRKRRDADLLTALLEMRLTTTPAFEAYMDVLAALWDEDPYALLRGSAASRVRIENMATVLAHVGQTINSAMVWQAYYRVLTQALRSAETPVRTTARKVKRFLEHYQRMHTR